MNRPMQWQKLVLINNLLETDGLIMPSTAHFLLVVFFIVAV